MNTKTILIILTISMGKKMNMKIVIVRVILMFIVIVNIILMFIVIVNNRIEGNQRVMNNQIVRLE